MALKIPASLVAGANATSYDDTALTARVKALEDAGFLTQHQSLEGLASASDLSALAERVSALETPTEPGE